MLKLSIVIPLYNEELNVPLLYKALKHSLRKITTSYELLFIDDGSTDGSLKLLKQLARKDKKIIVASFRRNQGKSEALQHGFQLAQGIHVATLDADLEDNPSDIERLLKKLDKGSDVVTGWRKKRKHAGIMIGASKLFNSIVGRMWGLRLHDYNCGIKVYKREVVKSLRLYGGLHRFIPLLAHQQGFRVTELSVSHSKRKYGTSKYGFSKVLTDAPDLATMWFITNYGKRPLHLFGTIGILFLLLGTGILMYLVYLKLFWQEGIGDRPLLLLGVLLVLSGFQLFFTGLLADLMLNMRYHDKEKEMPIQYSNVKK